MRQTSLRPYRLACIERHAMNRSDDHRWALVLAGGSGTRLASMTIDTNGLAVPKQYCALVGERSLLGDTLRAVA